MSEKKEHASPPIPLQARLPFAIRHAGDASESSAAERAVESFLDPGDPDSDLEGMSNDELREHLIELSEAMGEREEVPLRRLKAIFLLQRRGQLAKRRWVSVADVEPSSSKSRASAGPRKVGFRTALDRVIRADGVLGADRFAEWLAEDLYDASSIAIFRQIARGLRDGVLTRELVSEAWRRSKRPGIRNRSAFFRRFVWDRSPWAAAQRRDGRLRLQ